MDEVERANGVDGAPPTEPDRPGDAAASDGWAVPVVQTLPLTSGPSTADARRPSDVAGAPR